MSASTDDSAREIIDGLVGLLRVLCGKPSCLFIISHMRSRSSLLAHILGSHSEILGYSERHRSYASGVDLLKLRVEACVREKKERHAKHILDKVLHDCHSISASVLRAQNTRCVFLLREPEATTRSLIHMSLRTGVEYYAVQANAVDYYCRRLSLIREYASTAGVNGFLVESDDLIDRTSEVLDDLSAWMGLRTPLEPSYLVFEHTGQFGHGDPLENIRSGRVVRTRPRPEIRISESLRASGRDAYESCLRSLALHCPRRRGLAMTPCQRGL